MRAIQTKLNQLQLNQPYILPIMTKFFLQTLSSVVTINLEYKYDWGAGQLEASEEEKDVGVLISKTLKPSLQCARAAKKANQVLGMMSRAVTYRDKFTFTNHLK